MEAAGVSPVQGPGWQVEHRYRAVMEVLDGSPVSEVAVRYGVSRQSVYSWRDRYAAGGIDGLRDASRRPRTSPSRLPAEVEALVCELRRAHPRWGARRIAFEVAQRGVERAPSRATVHRVLERNGLVVPQAQRHKRKYKRWQRETPMALWQLDLVGGIYLADGRECKLLSGIDDHSRFVVCAAVLAVPSGRAVADAFTAAMRTYGVPSEVLTDNGKQFTGRFTKPRPAEVLFERVCREHGITAKLTGPYSPTTTGKVERWHRTLRRELLDVSGPFADLPSAQAAITAWVHAYNHSRPHQALDMATPASLFRPGVSPDREPAVAAPRPGPEPGTAAGPVPRLVLSPSGGAVEFETVISPAGVLSVLPRVQRLKMGQALAGQVARIWADEVTVHVLIGGQLARTVPSALDAEDLAELRMRGAAPAGPPPALPAPARAGALPAGTVIEVDRAIDANGTADLAGRKVKIGAELARARVTLRLDGHLLHVIADGVLAKTLPSPVPADGRTSAARRADRRHAAALPGPRSGQRPAQGPPRRRHHGHPPAAPRRRHLRRQDRHRPRRGHPLPRHLRRHRDIPPPPQRATPGQPVESQDPRPESRSAVQHVLRLSTTW